MSFTDPITLTYAAPLTPVGSVVCPRVSVGQFTSLYQSADGLSKVSASHQYGKRTREVLRFDYSKISPDPFIPATNVSRAMSCYIVFDSPAVGFSASEKLELYRAAKSIMNPSSDALMVKFLGGES